MKAKPGKEFTPDKAFLFKGIPVYFSDKGSGQAVVFLHGFLLGLSAVPDARGLFQYQDKDSSSYSNLFSNLF